MKLNKVLFLLIILSIFLNPLLTFSQITDKHSQGMAALNAKDTSNAVKLFKQSIKEENDAHSYFELAKIEINADKFFSFDDARAHLTKAVKIEPENVEYLFLLGQVLEKIDKQSRIKKFLSLNFNAHDEAIETYKKLLQIDPNHKQAHIRLAGLYKEDYKKYLNRMKFKEPPDYKFEQNSVMPERGSEKGYNNQLNQMILAGKTNRITFDKVAEENLENAVDQYEAALHTPDKKAYEELVTMFCNKQYYPKGIVKINEALHFFPKNKLINLSAAYLSSITDNYAEAKKYFDKAFELMEPTELQDYKINSVLHLLTPSNREKVEDINSDQLQEFVKSYWRMKNPLNITDYNERELEHYVRVFYANQNFGLPAENIKGWQTERGDIVIRYGEPETYLKINKDYSFDGEGPLPETEVFSYKDGKTFAFEDKTYNGEFVHVSINRNRKYVFLTDSRKNSEDLVRTDPEDFYFPWIGSSLNVVNTIAQFKGEDNKTNVWIEYAFPNFVDSIYSGSFANNHSIDFTFLDENFNTLAHTRKSVEYSIPPELHNYNNIEYICNSLGLNVTPSSGYISLEVLRTIDNGLFVERGRFSIKDFSTDSLEMSDIILGNNVFFDEYHSATIKRKNLEISPNPLGIFNKENLPFIYYEVYNLGKNEKQLTDFEQKIQIKKADDENVASTVLTSMLSFVGIGGEENKVNLSSNFNTLESDSPVYVQLDLSNYEPGAYNITVTVKDKLNGNQISNDVLIHWQ